MWDLIDGESTLRGIDPFALPPARFCNYVYHLLTRNMNAEARENIDKELDEPLRGEKPTDGRWSKEAMGADFMAAMRQQSTAATQYAT